MAQGEGQIWLHSNSSNVFTSNLFFSLIAFFLSSCSCKPLLEDNLLINLVMDQLRETTRLYLILYRYVEQRPPNLAGNDIIITSRYLILKWPRDCLCAHSFFLIKGVLSALDHTFPKLEIFNLGNSNTVSLDKYVSPSDLKISHTWMERSFTCDHSVSVL